MIRRKRFNIREGSFSLFEVIIAVMIMSTMLVELVGFQGNIIYLSQYGVNSSRAIWLAKRVMSKVEYYAQTRPWTELATESSSDVPFEDDPDFSYRLNIKVIKLDFMKLLFGGGDDKKEGEGAPEDPMAGAAKAGVNQLLGDEYLKIATVDVSWAEGARRDNVSLSLLLFDQRKVDDYIATLKPAYDELLKAEEKSGGTPSGPSGPTPPPGPGGGPSPPVTPPPLNPGSGGGTPPP